MKQRNILSFILVIVLFSTAFTAVGQLYDANIYLKSGEVVSVRDSVRIAMPVKKKKLKVYRNAYTALQKLKDEHSPDAVDSLVIWSSTSPERTHQVCYLSGYGWSWLLENGRYIRVYCYSPKGYYIGGNGGMWSRGKKSILIVEKDGRFYTFDNPTKWANDKFRNRVAALVADDPALAKQIGESNFRRDKTLRMLSLYSPIP